MVFEDSQHQIELSSVVLPGDLPSDPIEKAVREVVLRIKFDSGTGPLRFDVEGMGLGYRPDQLEDALGVDSASRVSLARTGRYRVCTCTRVGICRPRTPWFPHPACWGR